MQYLWLQENVACNDLSVRNVAGETNPADLLTKGLNQELVTRHASFRGLEVRQEENKSQPQVLGAVGLRRPGKRGGVPAHVHCLASAGRGSVLGAPVAFSEDRVKSTVSAGHGAVDKKTARQPVWELK